MEFRTAIAVFYCAAIAQLEPKRENERQSRPSHRMQPERRIGPEILDKKHQASDDMANDKDRQIGRRIVGPRRNVGKYC
jgi:hypothetical protein